MKQDTTVMQTNSVLQRYTVFKIEPIGRQLCAVFYDTASSNVYCMSGGGHAASFSNSTICHNIDSLERRLSEIRGLDGLDTAALAVWEKALIDLKAAPALKIAA